MIPLTFFTSSVRLQYNTIRELICQLLNCRLYMLIVNIILRPWRKVFWLACKFHLVATSYWWHKVYSNKMYPFFNTNNMFFINNIIQWCHNEKPVDRAKQSFQSQKKFYNWKEKRSVKKQLISKLFSKNISQKHWNCARHNSIKPYSKHITCTIYSVCNKTSLVYPRTLDVLGINTKSFKTVFDHYLLALNRTTTKSKILWLQYSFCFWLYRLQKT